MINTTEIELLNAAKGKNFLSIYIPTHRGGEPELEKEDQLLFKNQVAKAEKLLANQGMNDRQVDLFLKEIRDKLKDQYFWKHMSDALVVFVSEDFFRIYTLPIEVDVLVHLGSRFYTKTLAPLMEYEARFFILALSKKQVAFFEGGQYSITPVKINDLVPDNQDAALLPDKDNSNELQHRTGFTQGNAGKFHGHGGKKDKAETDEQKYLQQIDEGLMQMLHDENAPMIIMGDDALVGAYRKVNSYPLLYDEHISGNPDGIDPIYLHELAWDIIKPYFEKEKREKVQLVQSHTNGQHSNDLSKIIPAAMDGQVDTLFISKGHEIWGEFDMAKGIVAQQKEQEAFDDGLLNLAAIYTQKNGGKVYLLPQDEMPGKNKPVEALLRY